MSKGIPANLKTIRATRENTMSMYLEALSAKFQVLNFKAINFMGAFNKNELKTVAPIKNQGLRIMTL